jgi:tRNA/tmRNA/rRNA uracil-C5-methylase (TrmA/RlmC/RlmD family)
LRHGAVLPDDGVRTTMRLAVDSDGRLGFRAARSHDVVATSTCLVAHPAVDRVIAGLRLPGADEVTIRVGAATGEVAAWWTPAEVPLPIDVPADVLHAVSLGDHAVVHEIITGPPDPVTGERRGHRLRVSAQSFFQASLPAAEALVATVDELAGPLLAALPDGATVLDAYSGVGLFGATVVPARLRLVAVEGSRSACGDAHVNLAGRTAHVIRCSVERWRPEPASLVIADPSRSGLGAEASARLAATGAEHLVLVACDPVSLARDVRLLAGHGFALRDAVVLDLFPHTHHVEVVALLSRAVG